MKMSVNITCDTEKYREKHWGEHIKMKDISCERTNQTKWGEFTSLREGKKAIFFGNSLPRVSCTLIWPQSLLFSCVLPFVDIYFHDKWIWLHIILWFDKSIFHLLVICCWRLLPLLLVRIAIQIHCCHVLAKLFSSFVVRSPLDSSGHHTKYVRNR